MLPAALSACLICAAVGPRNGVALTGLVSAIVLPAVLALFRAQECATGLAARVLLIPVVAVMWLFAGGVLASDARTSLLGLAGQHSGAILWLGLLGVVAVLAVLPKAGDLLWATRAVAIFGGVGGVFAVLDATGVSATYRYSSEVSGLMESSSSLGQLALLGTGAAVACAIIEKRVAVRVGAGLLLLMSATGLVLSQSRGAWVGVLVGGVVSAVAHGWSLRRPVSGRRMAAVLVSVMALALTATMAVSVMASPTVFNRITQLSNQRAVLWRSAAAQVAEEPLLGVGPEQFSAWVTWSTVPALSVEKTAAYDPHNLLIYFLVAGGIPGLVLALGAAYSMSRTMFDALAGGSPGVAAVVAAEIAFVTALMFSWTSPLPATLAAVLLGALLGAQMRGARRESADYGTCGSDLTGWMIKAAVVLCAIVSLAALGPGVRAEYAWASAVDAGTVTPELLLATADATSDPSMAAAAAVGYPDEVADRVAAVASWHVDAAFELNQLAFGQLAAGQGGSWERVAETIELGIDADPTSGIWEYLAAAEAELLGMSPEAVARATRALDYPQPDAAREWLEALRAVQND